MQINIVPIKVRKNPAQLMGPYKITDLTFSNNAVVGRYILPKTIFNHLKNQKKGKGGEVHITDAIQSLIFNNNKFVGHNFAGKYLDCGTLKGYIDSSNKISKL